ncbi:MAG: hypothetical protein JWQ14_3018 [Adhaeribacter sp.]|nr:hypothetical protein [Adhaeribacter sp.]
MLTEKETQPYILSQVDNLERFNIRECVAFMRYLQTLEVTALQLAENKTKIEKLEKRFVQLMKPTGV